MKESALLKSLGTPNAISPSTVMDFTAKNESFGDHFHFLERFRSKFNFPKGCVYGSL